MSDIVRQIVEAEDAAERTLREQALEARDAILAGSRSIKERYIDAIDAWHDSDIDEAADVASRGGASQAVIDGILALKVGA